MHPESTFKVIWRGSEIGLFTVTATDHQYWEGPFESNGSTDARNFETLVKKIVYREVYQKWERGTRVELHSNEEKPTHAIVFGLESDNLLFVRFAYAPEVVDWMIKNVH